MAPQKRKRPTRDPAAATRDPAPPGDADRYLIGPVTRWREVAAVVRALGDSAVANQRAWPALERLAIGLTEPLRRLDSLAEQVQRALNGDAHAERAVRTTIRELGALVSGPALADTLGDRTPHSHHHPSHHHHSHSPGCGCGCGPGPASGTISYRDGSDPDHPITLKTRAGTTNARHEAPDAQPTPDARPADAPTILDLDGLTALLLGAADIVGRDDPTARDQALDVVTALALAAGGIGTLATSLRDGGRSGLVAQLESWAAAGALTWVTDAVTRAAHPAAPPTMSTMSGAGPAMPGDIPMPELPGLPGLPGGHLPGLPHGDVPGLPGTGTLPGNPDLDDLLHDRIGDLIAELLKQIRGRKVWDPDYWDPFPWWRPPREYIDPRWIEIIRCFLEARRLEKAFDEPPPTRPARAVWSDGITSVTRTGACAGATLTINGKGFGATQPTGVVLLVPTLDGCRPTTPTSWSDTRITAVLPADVASGSVGFADAAHVAAYDAWADRLNQADDALGRLWCAARVRRRTLRFHDCPPLTAINGLRAGAPVITAFTANYQTLLALEPGIPAMLRWTVRNAETVTVDRLSGSGPLLAGSTTLSNPAATAVSLGVPAYATLQVWQYRLTVTGACGGPVSRTVTIVAGRRPALRIETIEVTQSVQTIPAGVRLVEAKPTAVRVTVRHGLAGWGGDVVPNARGRIRARGPEVGTSPWFDAANGPVDIPMVARPGSSITVRANPSRNTTDDTLNFVIPAGWVRGTTTRFDVEVRVAGFGAAGGFAGYDDLVQRGVGPFVFERRRTLQFRYVRVSWGGVAAPTDQVCLSTLVGAVPLLPTPVAGVAPVPGVGIQNVNPGSNANAARRNLLDDWDDRHNCSFLESLTEWLGADCPDDDGAIWVLIPGQFVGGEAYDIPSNVCFTPPSNGPYAAHELAHCLNQQHIQSSCGTGALPVGGDLPGVWPNNAVLVDVPFDTVRNRALSLAGAQVGDLMTYCLPTNLRTWPLPLRWQRLWDAIGS